MTSFITIPRLIALLIALTPAFATYVYWKTDYQTSKLTPIVPVPPFFKRRFQFSHIGKSLQKKRLSFRRMSTYVWENSGNEDEWRKTAANVRKFAKSKTSDRIKNLSSCFTLDADELMGKQAAR